MTLAYADASTKMVSAANGIDYAYRTAFFSNTQQSSQKTSAGSSHPTNVALAYTSRGDIVGLLRHDGDDDKPGPSHFRMHEKMFALGDDH
jgi:hypothetical protein